MAEKFFCSGIADECADSIEQQVKMHRQLGWEYIEIRNVDRTTIDRADEDLFEKIVKVLEENDMKVSCLASDVGKLALSGEKFKPFENDLQSLQKLAGYAKRLNCSFIRVMAYQGSGLSDLQWRDEAVRRHKELAALAEKEGVYLALENCLGWHSHSGKNMAEFLDRVGSDHLVCLFDTGNPTRDGLDTWEFYEAVKERIKYIHIKDGMEDKAGFTYPGEGASYVRRVLEDQYRRGYRGFLSIEPHMASSAHLPKLGGGPEEAWRKYGEYGQKLNKLVEEICGK